MMTVKRKNYNVLITGATGLLGASLLKHVLKSTNYKIVLAIRSSGKTEATSRSSGLLLKLFGRNSDIANFKRRITVVSGDQTKRKLGLHGNISQKLHESVNEIYHCAALTNFSESLKRAREVNVSGIRGVLDFASECKHLHKINYVSTVFLAGTYAGEFGEDKFDVGQKFNNPYEQSKFEAEALVRQYAGQHCITNIFRPSIIVDEYCERISNSKGLLHQLFQLLELELFDEIPLSSQAFLNFVSSDIVAKAIFCLSTNCSAGSVYHIVNPTNYPLTTLVKIACNFLRCKIPKYVSDGNFNIKKLSPIQRKILEPFRPYFNLKALFVSPSTTNKLREFGFTYPATDDYFLMRLLRHAKNKGCL